MARARSTTSTSGSGARAPRGALWALLALAAAVGPWSVYQWLELLTALEGGEVACAVGPTLDCEKVWLAPAAKAVHRLSGVPIAGWGVVWSLAALAASIRLGLDRRAGRDLGPAVLGARLVAGVGAAGVGAFFAISASAGALCPTCLATYGLVVAFGAVAALALRGSSPRPSWIGALTPPAVAVAVGWLLMLYPGLSTPLEKQLELPPTSAGREAEAGATEGELERLVRGLPPEGKAALSRALAGLREPPKNAGYEPRRVLGPADAPVLLTDFSDLRCGHCKNLVEALHALEPRLGGRFAEDARYFPLSSNCNAEVPKELADPSGLRCFAAKALLCLEERPDYAELRRRLFAAQQDLSVEKVKTIVRELTGTEAAELQTCVDSQAVQDKLQGDIDYAMRYELKGTPLVLLNGREVPAHPTLLYALLLAEGDPEHPAFADLPAPASP